MKPAANKNRSYATAMRFSSRFAFFSEEMLLKRSKTQCQVVYSWKSWKPSQRRHHKLGGMLALGTSLKLTVVTPLNFDGLIRQTSSSSPV